MKLYNGICLNAVMPEPGRPGGPWPPQYLADQLTLFDPGEGRLSPPITTGPPNVFHLPASLINGYAFPIFFVSTRLPVMFITMVILFGT